MKIIGIFIVIVTLNSSDDEETSDDELDCYAQKYDIYHQMTVNMMTNLEVKAMYKKTT